MKSIITPFDSYIWFLGYLYSLCVENALSTQFPCKKRGTLSLSIIIVFQSYYPLIISIVLFVCAVCYSPLTILCNTNQKNIKLFLSPPLFWRHSNSLSHNMFQYYLLPWARRFPFIHFNFSTYLVILLMKRIFMLFLFKIFIFVEVLKYTHKIYLNDCNLNTPKIMTNNFKGIFQGDIYFKK